MPNEIIPSDAVRAIQDSVRTDTIEVPDNHFLTRQVFRIPPEPTPSALEVGTLTGLIEYIKNGPDLEHESDGVVVHVVDPTTVNVVSGLFGSEQRKNYLTANAMAVLERSDFTLGNFYDAEAFNIKLQSVFMDVEDRENVLRLVGNIKEENVRTTGDDGVTQSVVARSGVARVEEVAVPNPVTLVPYRTFREVDQPASTFVLRVRQGREGGLPSCALFEADGGKWKLTAIELIAAYLRENLEGYTIIA